jgi:hypothetical protein
MLTDAHRNILALMKADHVLTTVTEHGLTQAIVGNMAVPPELVDDLKAEGLIQPRAAGSRLRTANRPKALV